MIELRKARPGEEAAVAKLWETVFGDDRAFLERFYRDCAPFDQVMVLVEDGALCTFMTAPLVTMRGPEGREIKAGYLYALATEPAVRSRGFGREMMEYSQTFLREQGAQCALLVPAEPSLFRYFNGLGYPTAFSHLRREYTAAQCPKPWEWDSIRPAGPEEYNALRRKWLEGRLFMDCGDGMIRFQEYLAQESGGGLCRLELPGGPGCAVVERYGDTAVVKELLCAPEDIDRAVGLLGRAYPAEGYVLRLPSWAGREGERVLWGSVGWLGEDPAPWWPDGTEGYLGIALD